LFVSLQCGKFCGICCARSFAGLWVT
jgi:hypothetical protein